MPARLAETRAREAIGRPVSAIDTPALVIDLDAMERNILRMADFAKTHGQRLRPHAKTHKSAELARLQMAHGAVGVCVQKIDEALALAQQGVSDIYITNEVIDPAKLTRLALAAKAATSRFAIAVDSPLGVQRLVQALQQAQVHRPQALDVFVEIDAGQHRCGVPHPQAALALARQIVEQPALRFAGLQAYHGGAQHLRTPEQRHAALSSASTAVRETVKVLQEGGIEVPLVTGAGTGTFVREARSGLWGELQVGSYLFMDADYAANHGDPDAPAFEHALWVKSQVMSRAQTHAVCDAGHKSHAIDSGLPLVAQPPHLRFANGGDEHGLLHPIHDTANLPPLGETVWLIPGHCDPTVNLHDVYIGVRGGLTHGLVERVIAID
ncbi:MAG: DSD1 family PLP-dependent enzyme, partial [Burkholderiaceae bacterium]